MRQTPSFLGNFAILSLLKETSLFDSPLLRARFPHEEMERIEAWLRGGSCRCIMDAMQEVLSKTVDPMAPLEGQEFYELRIDDSDDIWRPGLIVVEAHAVWSVADKQIVWDEREFERCATYAEAKDRYEARRRALAERGFIYSDMEF